MPTLAELSTFAVAQNLLFLALAAYVARVRYRRPLTELGLRGDRWAWRAAGGIIVGGTPGPAIDRKSTRLNSSHDQISYAGFCLKKKKNDRTRTLARTITN